VNKRIKQLMERAMELVDPYAVEGECGPSQLNAEKFAQLIIQECAGIVKYYHIRNECVSPRQIKQHFGVEE